VGAVLQRVELFSSFSEVEIARAAAGLQETAISAGSQIVAQGDAGSTFYVVKSGIVKVFMTGAEGEEVVIKRRMGPGDFDPDPNPNPNPNPKPQP
jgi:CRP/FNR family cyclic AMP-dependent transcriptional regulator